ncbi:30S ribosome-binding factor RbfA [Thalassobius sp. Cn5-15]|jgi:ribosome-binding factor A|uniref:30S ribosome-binding factor RbfA n=1 Tax=Thalassobius sp. Cn5-15 TaxID=2917763 RepID=UPI00351D4BBB
MAKGNSYSAGPSTRQLRVGELIRRTMSDLLMRGEVHDDALARMSITVGEVQITSDLRVATCYVLPLGGKDGDEAVKILARNQGELRHLIGRKCGLKHAPELRFKVDTSFDRMDETRALLNREDVRRDLDKPDGESDDDAIES